MKRAVFINSGRQDVFIRAEYCRSRSIRSSSLRLCGIYVEGADFFLFRMKRAVFINSGRQDVFIRAEYCRSRSIRSSSLRLCGIYVCKLRNVYVFCAC